MKLYAIKNFINNGHANPLNHLAVIMDGNGRWAEQRGLPRWKGHEAGVLAVKRLADAAGRLGIPVVSLFAFSSENWKRPEREVRLLFALFRRYFMSERQNLLQKDIRIAVFGRRDRIPAFVHEAILRLEKETAHCRKLLLRIALDYGSRYEMVEAVRALVHDGVEGRIQPEKIDEELFSGYLSTRGIKDPDLVIRTAGEQRLSNFLLWQSAYAELYFCPKFWPDFDEADLVAALADFRSRTRRFGALPYGVDSLRNVSDGLWDEETPVMPVLHGKDGI